MTITTIASRELKQDINKVKKPCEFGPIYVTDRSEPTHVMMTIENYQKLVGNNKNIVELLAMDDENIELDPAKIKIDLFNVVDLS